MEKCDFCDFNFNMAVGVGIKKYFLENAYILGFLSSLIQFCVQKYLARNQRRLIRIGRVNGKATATQMITLYTCGIKARQTFRWGYNRENHIRFLS